MNNSKNDHTKWYYSGGLAELNPCPSVLSYSFYRDWFTGKRSIGKAMTLLKLPYEQSDLSLLTLYENELVVDLTHEEETLYKKTIFSYKKQNNIHSQPVLYVSFPKLLHPVFLFHTMKILLQQSLWIAYPKKTTAFAETLYNRIPDTQSEKTIEGIDGFLAENVWPHVFALGFLSEYLYQVLSSSTKTWHMYEPLINDYIQQHDWFFQSITDQQKVKEGSMPFDTYIDTYGIRADQDYELTSPRWYEQKEKVLQRIQSQNSFKKKQEKNISLESLPQTVQCYISLYTYRILAKKKALFFIDSLRQALLSLPVDKNVLQYLTKQQILQHDFTPVDGKKEYIQSKASDVKSGTGIGVSPGKTQGLPLFIKNADDQIPPESICIFPNATPQFASQYPFCKGIIFLKGGRTSHGAIVARELSIPAIISSSAATLHQETLILIDGDKGTWKQV